MDNKRIGELIRKKRKELHLTQAQLAHQLYVSTNAVSKWELGKNAIDQQNLELISKVLNIPISAFIDNEPEIPASDNQLSSPDSDCAQPIPEIDDSSPGDRDILPKEVKERKPGRRKIYLLFSVTGIVLAAAVIIVCLIFQSSKHSFVIQEEYFDTYEGQKACFLIADYKGKFTVDIMNEYSETIKGNYFDYFADVDIIIVLFYRDSLKEKIWSEDTADAISYLLPYTP